MQRQTLGNIQNIRNNDPRQSLSQAKNPKLSISNSRMSSFGTTITGQQKKIDQRNLVQKDFISKAVKDILAYVSNDYDQEINQKILRAPMTKDFVHLFEFLVRKIDPSFGTVSNQTKVKGNSSQFDSDLVISIFEVLGYPFPLNKRNLTSVGAPHAWPSLLAALVWLVELNQYKDSSENLISLDSNEENKQFFTYLSKSYQSYLRCESSDYVVMEDEIRKLFQVKDKEIIAEIEKYLSYIADLQQECDEYTESPLVQLEKKKKSYESEIDKLKQLISARFENKQNLDAKNEVLERESNKLAISIEKCQFERDILRKQVEQQELSPDDVKRMYNELNHLESSQITLTKQYQNVKQNEWNLEKETRNANEEIVSNVQNFNRKVTRLPQHLNILFDFQEIDTKSVESKLRKFQNENLSQLHLEQDLNLKLKDKLEKSEWEKETLMDTTKQSSMKIQGLEKQFKQEKEQWRSEMQQNAFNLESMEQENQKLKHLEQQDSDLKITSMQIETSMIELEKLKTKISNEEKQMTDLLYKTLELMTEHKTKNQFLLSNLEDKLKLTLNSVISTDDEMME